MALSKTERIELIQSGSTALADMGVTDAHLALDTFEIEDISWAPSVWGGSEAYAYCVDRLKAAPDETLINLNTHLSGEAPLPITAGSWEDDHIRVFLSHTATHRMLAGEIRIKLLAEDIDLFVAHDRIETNQEWITEIRISLATCDVLVALFTDDFLLSRWCDQEVGTALGRGIDVIPIMCGADPHGFVSPKQGFEVNSDDPHAATKIAAEICKNGHVAVFTGSIPGPDNANVVVGLEAESGEAWRVFRVYRTRKGGRFVMRYRFTQTFTPTTYLVHAKVRRQSGYSYEEGSSRTIPVPVVP